MEDVVYMLPQEARDELYAADMEATPMWFKNKHLPQADKSSGVVRFRSVTPKQQFVQGPDQDTNDVLDEVQAAAMRHRELAADHIAAALWINTEAPIVNAPAVRVKKTKTARVVIPLDHEHVTPKDFYEAQTAAGTQEGVSATNPVYIGRVGTTGDGRSTHEFEVTYTWTEKV